MALNINARFKEVLLCPTCQEYFSAPVSICPEGHSICADCRNRAIECPVCKRSYSSNSRNIVLEEMLESLTVNCTYDGCREPISLAAWRMHSASCQFAFRLKCIAGCSKYFDDLASHLLSAHDFREIVMERNGGLRSFSGPMESWSQNTEWPKGIWRLGEDAIVVQARTEQGTFHVYLFRLSHEKIKLRLKIKCPEGALSFIGKVPHVNEHQDKPASTSHFNCSVDVLVKSFARPHEEDPEILRLWMQVNRMAK
mmetsp:Transcript_3552/g.7616  ORF Transcript_3552/g.7616 Transcript_3552/m.7616 type:complete len:254 (-) Transcript_3552:586-1347(-)